MEIKYIKDSPNGKAGTTDTVTEFEGNILIKTGFAEQHTKRKRTKKQSEEQTLTDKSEQAHGLDEMDYRQEICW